MAVFEVDNEKELERLNKELENGLDWIECLDVKLPSSFKSELKDKEFDPENEIKREKALYFFCFTFMYFLI